MFEESGGFIPRTAHIESELVQYRRQGNHWLRYELAERILSGPSLLEIGCGCGLGTLAFGSKFENIVGIDTNAGAVGWATRYVSPLRKGSAFLIGEFESRDELQGKFDSVVAFEVLEHVREPRRFLGAIRSLLKPTGTVLLSTPNGFYSNHRHQLFRTGYHIDEYSLPELVGMMPESLALEQAYGESRVDRLDVLLLMGKRWAFNHKAKVSTAEELSRTPRAKESAWGRLLGIAFDHANGPGFWRLEKIRGPAVRETGYSTVVLHLKPVSA